VFFSWIIPNSIKKNLFKKQNSNPGVSNDDQTSSLTPQTSKALRKLDLSPPLLHSSTPPPNIFLKILEKNIQETKKSLRRPRQKPKGNYKQKPSLFNSAQTRACRLKKKNIPPPPSTCLLSPKSNAQNQRQV
jgi:hypothetical protein